MLCFLCIRESNPIQLIRSRSNKLKDLLLKTRWLIVVCSGW